MNERAMKVEWQRWCSAMTMNDEINAPMDGNPFGECWKASWRASYRARQTRRPLTNTRIRELIRLVNNHDQDWFIEFARLIERQHDVKGDTYE